EAARKAGSVSRVVLSSDDPEIMGVAAAWGCEVPFQRPAALATDEASATDVVIHALDHLPGHEYVALLQPTSPLRIADDIDAAFSMLRAREAPACVSVCEVEQSPYWMYRMDADFRMEPLLEGDGRALRRQDLPPVFVLNGAVYIARCD